MSCGAGGSCDPLPCSIRGDTCAGTRHFSLRPGGGLGGPGGGGAFASPARDRGSKSARRLQRRLRISRGFCFWACNETGQGQRTGQQQERRRPLVPQRGPAPTAHEHKRAQPCGFAGYHAALARMAPSLRFGTFGPPLAQRASRLHLPRPIPDGAKLSPSSRSTPRMSLFSILVIVGIVAAVVCFAALYSVTLS